MRIFDFIISISISITHSVFDRIIMKLADKVDMEEVLDKFKKVWKAAQSDN